MLQCECRCKEWRFYGCCRSCSSRYGKRNKLQGTWSNLSFSMLSSWANVRSTVTRINTKQSQRLLHLCSSHVTLHMPNAYCLSCVSRKALLLQAVQNVTQCCHATVVSGAAQHYYLPTVARQDTAVRKQPTEPDESDTPVDSDILVSDMCTWHQHQQVKAASNRTGR